MEIIGIPNRCFMGRSYKDDGMDTTFLLGVANNRYVSYNYEEEDYESPMQKNC